MKTLSTVPPFLLIMLIACSTREPVQILDGYEIPFSLEEDIRYYYHRLPENDTIIRDFTTTYENNAKFVIETSMVKGEPEGIRKFRVTPEGKQLIESIYYSRDPQTNQLEPIKGEIVKSARKADGSKYIGGEFVVNHRFSAGFAVRAKNVEKFLGEETYRYNDEDVPSVRFESNYHMRIYNQFFPFFWKTNEYEGYVIFSKGIGLTHFWAKSEEGEMEHRLIRWEILED